MGREIKRVALDFDWPMNMVWKGYVCPYRSQKCQACDGSGENPETKQLSDDWYDFEGTGRRWCDAITQDEVEALVDAGRLHHFTHDWDKVKGWMPKDPAVLPTAEEVNKLSREQGVFLHDAINRWICVETRAKRLGVHGDCPLCKGDGNVWFSDKIKELSDAWYEAEKYDPPEGEGWQVWETVSEGSPVSPVFATANELVDWLVEYKKHSRRAAESFVKGSGWAPSAVIVDGAVQVRLAKIDRQIAELQAERAKITGGKANTVATELEQPKKRVRVNTEGTAANLIGHLDVPKSSEELQKLTGLDKNRLRRGLQKLIDEGRVVTTGARRGTRYSLRAC